MNLMYARVALRLRGLAEILDLGAPFTVRSRRIFAPLAAWTLLPALLLTGYLRRVQHCDANTTWIVAVVLGGLLQGPFTLAAGELLFKEAADLRTASLLGRLVRRLPAYLTSYLLVRITLAASLLFAPLTPFVAVWLLFVPETVLLEGASSVTALRRSARFVRRQGMPAFGLVVALVLAPVVFALVAELLGQALVDSMLQLGKPFGDLFEEGISGYSLFGFFASIPYVASARFLKYIDIRTRKEGWDIQLRFLSAVGRAGAAAGVMAVLVLLLGPVTHTADARAESPSKLNPADLDAALKDTLGDDAIAFCHQPYPLIREEAAWCNAWAGSHPDRCPALIKTCKAGAAEAWFLKGQQRKPKLSWELPDLGGLGRSLLWALVLAAVVALVLWLVGTRVRARNPEEHSETPLAPASHLLGDDGAQRRVERDVDRLLAGARAAAAGGDFGEAIALLYAALLRRLDGDGLVHVHASGTNGDYLKELSSHAPGLLAPTTAAVRTVEAVHFGSLPATVELYEELDGRVSALVKTYVPPPGADVTEVDATPLPHSPVLSWALMMMALVASVSACHTDERGSWDLSPSGSRAVATFLSKMGWQTRDRIAPLSKLSDPKSRAVETLILLPDAEVTAADWKVLRSFVDVGGWLVVLVGDTPLPDWIPTQRAPSPPGGPASKGLVPVALGSGFAASFIGLASRPVVLLPGQATLEPLKEGAEPLLLRGGEPYAVEISMSARVPAPEANEDEEDVEDDDEGEDVEDDTPGRLLVVADDRLFVNASLPAADNARVLLGMLTGAKAPVEFVGDFTGIVSANPVQAVARGKLAPLVLQLGVFVTVLFLGQGLAFGRLRQPVRDLRRRFAEHIDAVGGQFARARAARWALALYGAWALDRMRARVRVGGGRTDATENGRIGDFAAAVAGRTGRPVGEIARLVLEVEEAARAERAVADLPVPSGMRARRTMVSRRHDRATETAALADLQALASLVAALGVGKAYAAPRATQTRSPVASESSSQKGPLR